MIVPSFDWTTFLARFFRKIVNINKFDHIHIEEGSTTLCVQECPDHPKGLDDKLRATSASAHVWSEDGNAQKQSPSATADVPNSKRTKTVDQKYKPEYSVKYPAITSS